MTPPRRARAWLAVLAAWGGALTLGAAPPAPPLPAMPPVSQPGVVVTFTSLARGAADARHDRLIALAVPAGTAPSALLSTGPFRAEWEADLAVPLRGDYTFSFAGNGAAELTLNGRAVLSETGPELGTKSSGSIQLNKGANRILVRYTSPATGGDAAFRLLWSAKDFGPEPIPPTALTADVSPSALREAARLRVGRELFAGLHCASCHDAGPTTPASMPELAEHPPSLAGAGARFRPEWIVQWILDPRSQRADARMPQVHLGAPAEAADIAAYLGSLGNPPTSAGPTAGDAAPAFVSAGGRLFSELRCAACHTLPGAAAAADTTRVSLAAVPAKWRPAALAEYLRDPRKLNESARMPDFRLTASEAAQLSAFLLASATPPATPPAGDAGRGRALFVRSCQTCHGDPAPGATGAAAPTGGAPALSALLARDWTHGCLAATPDVRGAAPDYGLAATQRDALRAFAASGAGTLHRDAPVEASLRAFNALRCAACHDRDGRPAGYSSLTAETRAFDLRFAAGNGEEAEGQSLDENPPSLTWTGEKLKTPWLQLQIAGDIKERARPWLKIRMPGFGPRAAILAPGLALEHGVFPSGPEPAHEADPDLAEIGARLVSGDFFSCTTCHAAGSTPALAPFGAPGINFGVVPSRLRYEYYLRWLDNPQRVEPATRMPRFTAETGKSLQPGILDGDAHAQWDAIREYLFQVMTSETPERK